MKRQLHSFLGRSVVFVAVFGLAAGAVLAEQPRPLCVECSTAPAPLSLEVRERLDKAREEPDAAAATTLKEAARIAEGAQEIAGLLAVAGAAHDRAVGRLRAGAVKQAQPFIDIALPIRTKHASETIELGLTHVVQGEFHRLSGFALSGDSRRAEMLLADAAHRKGQALLAKLAPASPERGVSAMLVGDTLGQIGSDTAEAALLLAIGILPVGQPDWRGWARRSLYSLAIKRGDLKAAQKQLLEIVSDYAADAAPTQYAWADVPGRAFPSGKPDGKPLHYTVRDLERMAATEPEGASLWPDLVRAIPALSRALTDPAAFAKISSDLVRTAVKMKQPDAAQSLLEAAVISYDTCAGRLSAGLDAHGVREFCRAARAANQQAIGLEFLARGRNRAEQRQVSSDLAGAFHQLARAARDDLGELARAQELFALAYDKAKAADAKRTAGMIQLDRAWIAYTDGNYVQAHAFFTEAFPHYPDATGLAFVATARGDLATSRALLENAIKFRETTGVSVLTPLVALAEKNLALGDYQKAKVQIEQSIALMQQQKQAPWLRLFLDLGLLAHKQGNFEEAIRRYQEVLNMDGGHPRALELLASVLDEKGDRKEAIATLKRCLERAENRSERAQQLVRPLLQLARLLAEEGKGDEAKTHLERASKICEAAERIPAVSAVELLGLGEAPPVTQPVVFVLSPENNSQVKGDEVEVKLLFLSPIPLARYRLWINGRPFGEAGFDVPAPDDKGQVLDRGRVLDKGRVLDRGQVLDKSGERQQVAKEFPEAAAVFLKDPAYKHLVQIRHTVPLEDTDGEYIRIAVQAETAGGSVSDRTILRLRRPQAEAKRGSLKVLSVGVGAYQNLPRLGFATADAVDLGKAFQAQGGERKLYRGADVTTLLDDDANLKRLRQALDQLATNVRAGDTVIVAFSGHGIRKGNETYFAPGRFDPENAEGTGLLWSEILEKMETMRKTAKTVWLLADCCRAASGLRRENRAVAKDLKRGVEEGGNLVVVTASSGDTPSYESADLRHGLFTQAWLDALNGKTSFVYEDRPLGKVLTLAGLQYVLDASVRKLAAKAGVRQEIEFPQLIGSFSAGMPVFVPSL